MPEVPSGTIVNKSEVDMLSTYWCLWYLGTDELWHQVKYELADNTGSISSPFFPSFPEAEAAARRLMESKDVREVEIREEKTVLALKGAAHSCEQK
jgi:hypothetical protein